MFFVELVFNVAVVIRGYRKFLILNELFFYPQFIDDIFLHFLTYLSGWPFSFVIDGESIRVFLIFLEKLEKSSSCNLQYLQDVGKFFPTVQILLEKHLYLFG